MAINIKEKIEKGGVHVIFVIEMAGRPPEHVKKVLEELVGHFGKQKGVEVLNQKMHEPEPVEKLFSCFAEIEFITEKFRRLLELIFYFMPSSIEIIAPEHIKLNVADANALANDLSTRLHQYDDIAKKAQIEKAMLTKQFEEKLKEKEEKSEKEKK
jgi:hypothetical protein